MIEIIKTDNKKVLGVIQILTVVVILLAYMTTRSLMLVAGLMCIVFLFMPTRWEEKIALMLFLLPFSMVFKLSEESRSVFMLFRLSIVVCYLLSHKLIFRRNFILIVAVLFLYAVSVSIAHDTDFAIRTVNIILCLLVGYIMQVTITSDDTLLISRSISNGTILSSIVGLNVRLIPNMEKELSSGGDLLINGQTVSRFTGLFEDPNLFSVLICISLWAILFEYNKKRIDFTEFMVRTMAASLFGAITMSKSCILLIGIFWLYVLVANNDIKFTTKLLISVLMVATFSYFIYQNPEWIERMLIRFFGEANEVDMDILTTKRSSLWEVYVENINQNNSWLFGNGINCELPQKMAAHNTPIQCIYNIGIVGLLLYVGSFLCMRKCTPMNTTCSNEKEKIGVFALFSLILSAFFLDGLFLEFYYYVLPLCFIYEKNVISEDLQSEKINRQDSV